MTTFEKTILDWIGTKSADPELQVQLKKATVSERKHTGVGCYTEFEYPDGTLPTQADYKERGPITGPEFKSEILQNGGGTLLWMENGFAKSLEIYTYDDQFPDNHDELGIVTLEIKNV
ncbi:hypothetical protein JYT61_01325 [bacterium AH-315-E10]|nr:hypothetical protein [bacterium AH-315-E10]